ncbi:GerMN domain-containing protein [Anaeromicrobium sediminis]|nr:GerMN domain-containing protein [Anaeromicrobium sediminis]
MKKKIILGICMLTMATSLFIGCGKKEEQKQEVNTEVPAQEEVVKEEAKDVNYVLYLKNRNMPYLFDERYTIKEDDAKLEGKTMEEFVMNELINFKEFGEYENPIPKGTNVLSIEKEGPLVTVNLSEEFNNFKGTKDDVELLIASIVNSLTILPGNEKVQILVEGKVVENIGGVKIKAPLEYFDNLYPDK